MKGATTDKRPPDKTIICFNPRAREGRDSAKLDALDDIISVSIHAPVKGATNVCPVIVRESLVSIHAPVKGATG